MDPEDVHSAIQLWVDKSLKSGITITVARIRDYVFLLLSPRFMVDVLQGFVLDMGAETVEGNRKEGYQIKVVRHSIEEWNIRFADCEITVPKPKPVRALPNSVIEDREKFAVTKLFLERYE